MDKSISFSMIISEIDSFDPDPKSAVNLIGFLKSHFNLAINMENLDDFVKLLNEQTAAAGCTAGRWSLSQPDKVRPVVNVRTARPHCNKLYRSGLIREY